MFFISEDELRFKQETVRIYLDKRLSSVCINELLSLKDKFPISDFESFSRKYFQFFLNRTYLDDIFVFFQDGSILKVHYTDTGIEWSEYYDNEISTAFYYGRYSFRII